MKTQRWLPAALFAVTLLPCPAAGDDKIETGDINGSSFRIDVPANYNGSLVMYCHGYGGGIKFDQKPLIANLKVFTDAGYAIAQAGYAGGGWAVAEALQDTEALRRYYGKKYGAPKRTFVTGHSMGGIITLAILEKFPESYDGALPICGPLAPSLAFLQRRVFDLLVVFDYYYPGALGSPTKISDSVQMSAGYALALQKIIDTDPKKRAAVTKFAGFASEAELAIGVGFFANIQKELMVRAGGNPFDNRNTLYYGSADDVAVNRCVKRYEADARAVEYLRHYYGASGRPVRPILAIHTVYDPIVPTWAANGYDELVRANGAGNYFVQRFTAHAGHCGVKPDETMHAMEDLARWVDTGERPAPGEQK